MFQPAKVLPLSGNTQAQLVMFLFQRMRILRTFRLLTTEPISLVMKEDSLLLTRWLLFIREKSMVSMGFVEKPKFAWIKN